MELIRSHHTVGVKNCLVFFLSIFSRVLDPWHLGTDLELVPAFSVNDFQDAKKFFFNLNIFCFLLSVDTFSSVFFCLLMEVSKSELDLYKKLQIRIQEAQKHTDPPPDPEHHKLCTIPMSLWLILSLLSSVLWIQDVYPGSDFFPSRILDPNGLHPGSRIPNTHQRIKVF